MPTLLIWRGYKFRFYSSDAFEPPHVRIAKVWLRDLKLASNHGYSDQELRSLMAMVSEHQREWIGAWNEFFGL